ncbi:hypothetical protein ACFWMR_02135 [Amycolatopsis thailandensis]|uniref:hypothetical protein n=1 Tax=Amycolatopsis thailandensis TaxID=589330 RepID=UPI003665BC2B
MNTNLEHLRELARGTTEDVARARALAAVAQAEAIAALVEELHGIRALLDRSQPVEVTVNVGGWQRFGRRGGQGRLARFGLRRRGGMGRPVQTGMAVGRGSREPGEPSS